MSSPFHPRPAHAYLLSSPLLGLLAPIHSLLLHLRGPPQPLPPSSGHGHGPIRVVCVSDTHTQRWEDVPDGDLLIHAGDLSNDGSVREIQEAVDWLKSLPHRQKVVVCGNHDSFFDWRSRRLEDREPRGGDNGGVGERDGLGEDKDIGEVRLSASTMTASIHSLEDYDYERDINRIDWGDIHYLQHSSVTLTFPPSTASTAPSTPSSPSPSPSPSRPRTLTIYGAPQIPSLVPFGPEHAFTYPAHHDAWSSTIPPETDILITHTPPAYHRDLSPVFSAGCPFLLAEIWRVRPALHVFGHVHAAYGVEPVFWDEAQRAWERLCERRRVWLPAQGKRTSGIMMYVTGILRDLVDVQAWVDAARVVVYGVVGVVWARVWGRENRGCGWMVNAACMYRNSGRLGNEPVVVEL